MEQVERESLRNSFFRQESRVFPFSLKPQTHHLSSPKWVSGGKRHFCSSEMTSLCGTGGWVLEDLSPARHPSLQRLVTFQIPKPRSSLFIVSLCSPYLKPSLSGEPVVNSHGVRLGRALDTWPCGQHSPQWHRQRRALLPELYGVRRSSRHFHGLQPDFMAPWFFPAQCEQK